jgi:hypothetical protein
VGGSLGGGGEALVRMLDVKKSGRGRLVERGGRK